MWLDYGLAVAIAYLLGRKIDHFNEAFSEFKGEMKAATAALKENLAAHDTRLSMIEQHLASDDDNEGGPADYLIIDISEGNKDN